ncbi:hypothetical protein QB910_000143 [Dabrowskivirus KKP3916]|uniref:Uncharacterized protein n=1 Tax=Alicyclobacillus phage KKP_3916 TaxID=3040651 RepID=A0AAT9V8V0_9CAUD|nr:hypothetical protein QB910_000143 [Alicyclobacillus phage KKP 3916]
MQIIKRASIVILSLFSVVSLSVTTAYAKTLHPAVHPQKHIGLNVFT